MNARARSLLFVVVLALLLFLAGGEKSADAFCGFYVNTGGERLFNEASRVVLMRVGMRTVLSLQNDYKGPLENFALVVPVPVVLEKKNVRTLPNAAFNRVDKLTSPRLVEYWEQDPCPDPREEEQYADNKEGGTGTRAKGEEGSMGEPRKPLVKVEAEFSVDEYDIVILSALDSGALETWLRDNKYVIPAGAEPYLRPYVQEGSKFFVARVDASRVRLNWGRAQLSPLRFFYDTPSFTLPTRLGLINSAGVQDLLVYMLGPTRFESANYENLFIPTNLSVKDETRHQFNGFYASLFDHTVAKHPHSVVTEYAWAPSNCDPCPAGAGPLSDEDMQLFGADAIAKSEQPNQYVLTRLHARYGKDAAGDDLVFKSAPGVIGGREDRTAGNAGNDGLLQRDPVVGGTDSSFQGRYIIRHPWSGPVPCMSPRWGVWGGPPDMGPAGSKKGGESKAPPPSAFARRDLDANDFILDVEVERRIAKGGGGGTSRSSVSAFFHRLWQRIAGFTSHRNTEKAHVMFLFVTPILAGFLAWRRKAGIVSSVLLIVPLILIANYLAGITGDPRISRMSLTNMEWLFKRAIERTLVNETFATIGTILGAIGVVVYRKAALEPKKPERNVGLLFISATLPIFFGIFACMSESSSYDSILSEVADVEQRSRIAAEMAGEVLVPMTLSMTRAAILLCVAAFFVVRVIRVDAAERKWSVPFIAAPMAIATHFVVMGGKVSFMNSFDGLGIVVFLGAAIAIELVDVRRVGGVATFFALVVAVLLIDVAAKNRSFSAALTSVTGESVDPIQKAFILEEMVSLTTKRAVIAAIDAGLLIALVLYRIKRLGPTTQSMPLLRWVETRWGLISTATLVIMLVTALTTIGWTRSVERATVLEASVRHLAWHKGEPPVPSTGLPRGTEVSEAMAGPAILVDTHAKVAYASAGPGKTPAPLNPTIYAAMAQAAAESDLSPLLVLQGDKAAFSNVMDALSPLLTGQPSYRLVPDIRQRRKSTAALGDFGIVATLAGFEPTPIDIMATIPIGPRYGDREESPDGFWYGFVLGREHLHIVSLHRGSEGWAKGSYDVKPALQQLAIDGGGGSAELGGAIRGMTYRTQVNAIISFHPDTPVETVARAIKTVSAIEAPWVSWTPRRQVFTKIVVSPSSDVLMRL